MTFRRQNYYAIFPANTLCRFFVVHQPPSVPRTLDPSGGKKKKTLIAFLFRRYTHINWPFVLHTLRAALHPAATPRRHPPPDTPRVQVPRHRLRRRRRRRRRRCDGDETADGGERGGPGASELYIIDLRFEANKNRRTV